MNSSHQPLHSSSPHSEFNVIHDQASLTETLRLLAHETRYGETSAVLDTRSHSPYSIGSSEGSRYLSPPLTDIGTNFPPFKALPDDQTSLSMIKRKRRKSHSHESGTSTDKSLRFTIRKRSNEITSSVDRVPASTGDLECCKMTTTKGIRFCKRCRREKHGTDTHGYEHTCNRASKDFNASNKIDRVSWWLPGGPISPEAPRGFSDESSDEEVSPWILDLPAQSSRDTRHSQNASSGIFMASLPYFSGSSGFRRLTLAESRNTVSMLLPEAETSPFFDAESKDGTGNVMVETPAVTTLRKATDPFSRPTVGPSKSPNFNFNMHFLHRSKTADTVTKFTNICPPLMSLRLFPDAQSLDSVHRVRSSSTTQIFGSRSSAYEVIWEEGQSSNSDSSNPMTPLVPKSLGSPRTLPDDPGMSPPKNDLAKLAAWAWRRDQGQIATDAGDLLKPSLVNSPTGSDRTRDISTEQPEKVFESSTGSLHSVESFPRLISQSSTDDWKIPPSLLQPFNPVHTTMKQTPEQKDSEMLAEFEKQLAQGRDQLMIVAQSAFNKKQSTSDESRQRSSAKPHRNASVRLAADLKPGSALGTSSSQRRPSKVLNLLKDSK
jgi:hypothetical protein